MGRLSTVLSVALVPSWGASGPELLDGTVTKPFSTSDGAVRLPVIWRMRSEVEPLREIRYTPPELPWVTQGWIAPSQGSSRNAVTVPSTGVPESIGALSIDQMVIWLLPPTW